MYTGWARLLEEEIWKRPSLSQLRSSSLSLQSAQLPNRQGDKAKISRAPSSTADLGAVIHSKAIVFPIVMYGCKSRKIKNVEHWRTDAFELWSWKIPLRVPWTARRSNQSILKEINSEYLLERLLLKLKLQHFEHLMQRADSLEKPWCWSKRRRGMVYDNMVDSIADSIDMNSSKRQEMLGKTENRRRSG